MENLMHLYTGDDKGKTTASMGAAIRMLGHGGKVLVVQFMKQDNSGELVSLKKLGANVYKMPAFSMFTYQMDKEQLEYATNRMRKAIDGIINEIAIYNPALTVLDELSVATGLKLINEQDANRLIDAALSEGECIVTGRYAPQWLIDRANYVSEIKSIKHPFDSGINARKGIEW